MNDAKHRPYLTDRRCGQCLVPLEVEEKRENGWLFVTYRCPSCDFRTVVTFSPQELAEWARRGGSRPSANSMM